MGTSMIKEWRRSLLVVGLLVIFGVSISARHINQHERLKRGAEMKAPAAPPPGALPHPVVQVPEHVNEPKVAAGEQHASGMIKLFLL